MTGERLRALVPDAAAVGLLLVATWLALRRSVDVTPDYDEGVYVASLAALRRGDQLGGDVFASQPPGFYVLIRIAGALGGATLHDLRIAFLVIGLGGVASAYAAGRALSGRPGGLAAGALVAVAAPWVTQLGRVSADAPALVLALAAVALAAHGLTARGRTATAALSGAALVGAVLVKLFAVTVLVPIAALAVSRRAGARQVVAAILGGAVVALAVAVAYWGVLGDLWRDGVDFHQHARALDRTSVGTRLHRILDAPGWHTPFAWTAAAAAVLALAALLLGRPTRTWPLWSWVLVSGVYLAWQRPLFDHHLVLLVAPLALAAGTTLGALAGDLPRPALAAAVAVVAAVAAAALVQQHRRLAQVPTGIPPPLAWAAGELRRCTPVGSEIVTDQPLVAVLAHRRLPGQLVDTSEARLASGSLTAEEVERAASGATAAFAGRAFQTRSELLATFRRRLGPPRRFEGVSLYLARDSLTCTG